MLNSILVSILLQLVSRLTKRDFVESVKSLVISYINKDMEGEEKRKAVVEQIKQEGWSFANYIVNLVIESVLAYLKIKQPKLFS